MRYLVDTHALLWARADPELLSDTARGLFLDPASSLAVSIASRWECAIKQSVGKLKVPPDFYPTVASDYAILRIEIDHIEACERLPMVHRDPFDRLLVAQAQVGDLAIVTRDRNIARYDVAVVEA